MATDLYPPRHEQGVLALAAYLDHAGVARPGDFQADIWLPLLRRVPRHLFVPSRAWAQPMDDQPEHVIDRGCDPDTWWDAVYSNTAVITQRGDGSADVDDTTAPPTSSLSCPHVAVEMLLLLEVDDHHRVLEIGTGTGWTASMLAQRLSDDQVLTVEVDEDVARQAAANLNEAGTGPTLVVGDGMLGHPDAAPVDRVHVTCGIRDVPGALLEQTRPGGQIVAPWMPAHGRWGELVRLDVLNEETAVGRFYGGATFMMARSQRPPLRWPAYPDEGTVTVTRLDPRAINREWGTGFGLYLAGAVPGLVVTSAGWEQLPDREWGWIMRLRSVDGSGWAIATAHADEPDVEVVQGGSVELWNQLQAAFLQWLHAGRPGRDRLGLTATRSGHFLWLDSPNRRIRPLPRPAEPPAK